MKALVMGLLLVVGLIGGVTPGWCGSPDEGWKAVGIRAGVSATTRSEYFHQYEVFAAYGLPWSLRAESGWGVALRVNASVGALHGGKETGVIGSVGPGVIVDKGGKGLAFTLGGDLYGMSRFRYGNVDLNGDPLFEGNLGVMYRFDSGPGVGYRFQHMSNGGLGRNGSGNTGLDLHMLELSWNFH
jgi:hypothetical protein